MAATEWVIPEAEPGALTLALRRRPWLGPTLAGVGLGLATAYTAWQDPNGGGVFPACPLKSLTGLDCPGCGGLRAVHALTRGDVVGAFDHNVFVAVLVPLLAVLWALWFARGIQATLALRRQRRADDGDPAPAGWRVPAPTGRFWFAVGTIAIGFAVIRNIDAVPLFEYLNSDA